MNCPTCHHAEHQVLRTDSARKNEIRRIRSCCQCGQRWATLEQMETVIAEDRKTLAKARELAESLVGG